MPSHRGQSLRARQPLRRADGSDPGPRCGQPSIIYRAAGIFLLLFVFYGNTAEGEAARSIFCGRLLERLAAYNSKKPNDSALPWRCMCVFWERAAAEWALWRLGVRAEPETKQLSAFLSKTPVERNCLNRRVQPHSSSAPEPERARSPSAVPRREAAPTDSRSASLTGGLGMRRTPRRSCRSRRRAARTPPSR